MLIAAAKKAEILCIPDLKLCSALYGLRNREDDLCYEPKIFSKGIEIL